MAENQSRIVLTAVDNVTGTVNKVSGALNELQNPVGNLAGAFSGLAAAAGAFTLGALVKGAIDGAAELNDLALKTGASVEALSALKGAARIAGTDLNSVGDGLAKLGRSMGEALDGTGKSAKVFDALGISIKDSTGKLRDTDGVFLDLAKAIAQIESPTERVIAAQATLGKSGAQLLPLLMDLSTQQELVGKITTAQAAAADELTDNIGRLGNAHKAWVSTLAMELVPAANAFVVALLDQQRAAGSLTSTVKTLAGDGTLKDWAVAAARAAGFVVDAFEGIVRVVRVVGNAIGATAAQIAVFSNAWSGSGGLPVGEALERYKQAFERMGEIRAEATRETVDMLTAPMFSDRLESQIAKIGQDTAGARAGGKSIADALGAANAGKESRSTANPYADLQSAAQEWARTITSLIRLQSEATTQTQSWTKAQREITDLVSSGAWDRLDTNTKVAALAAYDAAQAAEEQAAALKDLLKWQDEWQKSIEQTSRSLSGQVTTAEDNLATLGMTRDELAAHLSQKDELAASSKREEAAALDAASVYAGPLADSYRIAAEAARQQADALQQVASLRRNTAAKEAAVAQAREASQAWQKFADDIERALTDSLMRSFDAGKGFGDTFVQAIQNTLKTAVFKVAVQAVVDPIMGQARSLLGSSGGAGGFGNVPMGGEMFNSFATSGIGQSLGLSTDIGAFAFSDGASLAAGGAQLTGLGSSIGAALPWVGGALAIASMAGLFGDDGPAMRQATFRQGGNGDYNYRSPFGNFSPWDNNQWFGDDMAGATNAFADEIAALDQQIVTNLGLQKDEILKASRALRAAPSMTADFGMEGTDWRQSNADEQFKQQRYGIIAKSLGMTVAELQQAVETPISALRKSFSDLFDSAAQQAAKQAESFGTAMQKLGLELPSTRDEFIALVQGSTGSLERSLLGLAQTADKVYDQIESTAASAVARAADLSRQSRSLDIALMRARGDVAGATAAERADTLAAISDTSQRAKQQAIFDALDAAAAAEASAAAHEDMVRAYESESNALRAFAEQMQSFADNLTRYRATLGLPGNSGEPTLAQTRGDLQGIAVSALAGDTGALQSLPGSVGAMLDASRRESRNRIEFARDQGAAFALLDAATAATQAAAVTARAKAGTDDVVDQLAGLRAEIAAANTVANTALVQATAIFKRWDGNGLPGTRT